MRTGGHLWELPKHVQHDLQGPETSTPRDEEQDRLEQNHQLQDRLGAQEHGRIAPRLDWSAYGSWSAYRLLPRFHIDYSNADWLGFFFVLTIGWWRRRLVEGFCYWSVLLSGRGHQEADWPVPKDFVLFLNVGILEMKIIVQIPL